MPRLGAQTHSPPEAAPGSILRVRHEARTLGEPTHLRTAAEDLKRNVWSTDMSTDACVQELQRRSDGSRWQLGWLLVHLLTGRDLPARAAEFQVEDDSTADGFHLDNLRKMIACVEESGARVDGSQRGQARASG